MSTKAKLTLGVLAVLGAVALLFAAGVLWFVTLPWRILLRAYFPKRSGRTASVALVEATVALALSAFGLRRQSGRLVPAWRPCENCGAPIDHPSRAAYCSQACRRDASIRSRAALEGVASYD